MKPTTTYHFVTKSFHWLVVILISVEFAIGWLMPDVRPSTTPEGLISFHLSFGILILLVMLVRILFRFVYAVPKPQASSPWWQELAASWTHYLLYITVALLPVTGWWLASAHGWATSLFGWYTLPALVSDSSTLSLARITHVGLGLVVLGLIGLHVLAALYHYYIVKDKVMQRMLPKRT